MLALEFVILDRDNRAHFVTSFISFVYPDQVIAEIRLDEAVDLIQRLFKTGRTEFSRHLPFVEPSELTASLSTW
ncbi:uncharacterized protein METZ01_LOCUS453731, partial [marine metagenome]